MPPKFQIYKDAAEEYRFRVVSENNDVVASSEAYEQYASCLKGIESVRRNSRAEVEDLIINDRKLPNPKYQIYKDTADKFRFRLKAANGEIVAQGEGYETKEACMNGIKVVGNSYIARIDDSAITGKPFEESMTSEAKQYATSAGVTIPDANVKTPEMRMPEVKAPEFTMPNEKMARIDRSETRKTGMSVLKELLISFIGLIIALIFSALALGIANWGIGFFGITGDVAKAAAIIAVAVVIGPTIAAFATKKYF